MLRPNSNQYNLSNNINQNIGNNSFFFIPGTFQSSLSPRFDPNNYGALISYNLPNFDKMAAPPSPISYIGTTNNTRGIINLSNLPLSPTNWYQYAKYTGPQYNINYGYGGCPASDRC